MGKTKTELLAELDEFRKKAAFRCKHGHDGASHKNCYRTSKGLSNRIGYIDNETYELTADWGFLLSYCIKRQGGSIIRNVVKGEDISNWKVRDRNIVRQCCEDMKKFDTLVVYYGKDTGGKYQRHDIPFVRTRALNWGLNTFPKDRNLIIIDIYDAVKAVTKQKSNSMRSICRLLKIPCKETELDWVMWQRARDGEDKALRYVLKHNAEDVVSTELVFDEIYPYKKVKVLI